MTHKQDFIESFRAVIYPRLHVILEFFDLYAAGQGNPNAFVGTVNVGEEELEEYFHAAGVIRNALAKYKTLPDGRESEGSWRITHGTHPQVIEDPEMQLHFTLYKSPDKPLSEAVDIYAHYEKNYGKDPRGHLRAHEYSAEIGVNMAHRLIENTMSLEVHNND